MANLPLSSHAWEGEILMTCAVGYLLEFKKKNNLLTLYYGLGISNTSSVVLRLVDRIILTGQFRKRRHLPKGHRAKKWQT